MPWTSSERTWRRPLRRRSMSAVRRASKYDSGSSSRRPETKSSASASSRTAARASIRRWTQADRESEQQQPDDHDDQQRNLARVAAWRPCRRRAGSARARAAAGRPPRAPARMRSRACRAAAARTAAATRGRDARSAPPASRGVGRKVAHHPDHFSSTSARVTPTQPAGRVGDPHAVAPRPRRGRPSGCPPSARSPAAAARRGDPWRPSAPAPRGPASSAARTIPRRLVPSCPVPAARRMNVSDTERPKARQTIASAAAPQSAKSIWRTNGKRRGATHGSAGAGASDTCTPAAICVVARRAAAAAVAASRPDMTSLAAEVQRPDRDAAEVQSRAVLEPARRTPDRAPRARLSTAPSSSSSAAFADRRHGRKPRRCRAAHRPRRTRRRRAGSARRAAPPLAGVLDQPPGLDDPPVIGALSLAHDHVAVVTSISRPRSTSSSSPIGVQLRRRSRRRAGTRRSASRRAWAPNPAAASGCARASASATGRSSRSTRTALEAARRVTAGGRSSTSDRSPLVSPGPRTPSETSVPSGPLVTARA